MCGICGIYNFRSNELASETVVRKMMDAMEHRGPDDEGVYTKGPLSIGMRRLSIIDRATGKQPMCNETEDVWVVYNGEIYNYLPLMEELRRKGHIFRSKSDTEVIVHLYEEYGTDSFSMLNGMFAIALWDNERKTFYLVRDRFGIKPLAYSIINGRLIFGSEIHLLFKDPDVSKEINLEALDLYFAYYYINAPHTIFNDVKKVPSASYLECKNGNINIIRYWNLQNSYTHYDNEEDYTEKIRDLMSESVKLQLQSEVPLGVFLSGGLDSTSILAFMRQHLSGKIKTFSIGFEDSSYSELPEADAVAKMYETEHHPTVMYPKDIPELLPKLLKHMGEPNGDWSGVANYLVSQEAKKSVTVVLRGDGGDEIFGGYPTYNAANLARLARKIPKSVRNRVINRLINFLPVSHRRLSFDYKAKRFLNGIDLPVFEAHHYWKEVFPPDRRNSLISSDYYVNQNGALVMDEIESIASEMQSENIEDTLTYLDLRIFNQGCTLPVSDITSMAVSLEGRVPFLHNEVVDFAYSIPFPLKNRGMQTKYIYRKAMQGLLPNRIVRMKKKGFVVPGASWIFHELKPYIIDVLSESNITKIPCLNAKPVQKVLKDHFEMKVDNTRQITCLVAFVLWYDCFH